MKRQILLTDTINVSSVAFVTGVYVKILLKLRKDRWRGFYVLLRLSASFQNNGYFLYIAHFN
jgi:hypothetical protein